jgi:hypothetical protein
MKRFLTSDDYIVSLDQLLEDNEFSQEEIDELRNMQVGAIHYYTLSSYVMRIPDGEYLSSHKRIEYELSHLIADELEQSINATFIKAHEQAGTKHGDITPDQALRLDELRKQLTDLMVEQVVQNLD